MKKTISLFLSILFIVTLLTGCNFSNALSKNNNEQEYHDLVYETQELLDIVADDIYSYWYDCIYNDKYNENINLAILYAQMDNEENITKIKENNDKIKELYSKVKDGELKSETKAVMQAYNDYYSFVMEVSGSFNSFSANKETLKKELSSALRDLEFEL